jgi:hypothetical protein
MKRICAWCRTEIGHVDGGKRFEDEEVSHGICERCADNIVFQQGVPLPAYIESLDMPVLLINDQGTVIAGNAKARSEFGAEYFKDGKKKHATGEIFECQFARLPEGCGRTIHCSGCAIRRTISSTIETGEPQSKIPATLSRGDPDNPESIALSITTVKVANAVVLKVEYRGKNRQNS